MQGMDTPLRGRAQNGLRPLLGAQSDRQDLEGPIPKGRASNAALSKAPFPC